MNAFLLKLLNLISPPSVSEPVEPSRPVDPAPPTPPEPVGTLQPIPADGVRIFNWYNEALPDVRAGRNLALRREETKACIEGLDDRLARAKREGASTEVWEKLKNEMYYLIWQIDEQTGPHHRE